jgi:uncharacterized membrane protein
VGHHRATPFSVCCYGVVQLACAMAFYCLRACIFHHHAGHAQMDKLSRLLARKNLIASLIYLASIPAAFVYVPLSLGLIMLPAAMYFLPDRRIEDDAAMPTGPHGT